MWWHNHRSSAVLAGIILSILLFVIYIIVLTSLLWHVYINDVFRSLVFMLSGLYYNTRVWIFSLEPLKGYQGEDIEIQLPRSLTMHSIDWLAVWCVQYTHNFGHVNVPDDLDVPPALGQTKLTVSSRLRGGGGGGQGKGGRPTTVRPTQKPRRHQTWSPPQPPPWVFGSYQHTKREVLAPVPRYPNDYYYRILWHRYNIIVHPNYIRNNYNII